MITIDGIEVYNETASMLNSKVRNAVGAFGGSSPSSAATGSLASLPFNSSLLIEFASDGTNLGTCNFRYYLT